MPLLPENLGWELKRWKMKKIQPWQVKCWSQPHTKEVNHLGQIYSFVFGAFHYAEI
jgi:hypothetical protein